MLGSDHEQVVAYLEDKVVRRKWQFRFDNRWIGQEDLMDSITTGWSEDHAGHMGDIMANISNFCHEIAK